MKWYLFISIFILSACKCNNTRPNNEVVVSSVSTKNLNYQLVKVYPHDTSSFTQGLVWHEGFLYEGTGLEGESKLMKVDLITGKTLQSISLAKDYFGEGITILNNKIYQLTWQNKKIFIYDLKTFKKIGEQHWDYEGWGITNDGKNLWISTGSSNLYKVNPDNFQILSTVGVTDNYGPLGNINELEMVNGKLYANIYLTDYIAEINPETGVVEGKINLQHLLTQAGVAIDQQLINNGFVLNGIAYNATQNVFYITGKKWPALFEIKLN